jgi:hypothetical protein
VCVREPGKEHGKKAEAYNGTYRRCLHGPDRRLRPRTVWRRAGRVRV